jgi:phosphate-selective porin OprO/OprP
MKSLLRAAFAASLAASLSAGPLATDDESSDPEASGLSRYTTLLDNEDVMIKFFGRIQNDWTWITGDDPFDSTDGVEFRRARVGVSGTLYDFVDFKAEYDFAGGDADFADVYIGAELPSIGTIQVGHFKEPFSLEEQTSSRFTTFAERALPNAFSPARNTGIMLAHHTESKRLAWAAGVFRPSDSFGDSDSDSQDPDAADAEYAFSGRVTGLPMWEDDGERLVHVGGSFQHRQADNDEFSFSARPEAHFVDAVVSTGAIPADDAQIAAGEAALVLGPFSLQGEYVWTRVNASSGASDADYSGYYVEGSWFLTGEHRHYEAGNARFGRIHPNENVTKNGGKGAWQLAARYSCLDLDDGPSSDQIDDVTLGVNWHLNPNARITLNYIHSWVDASGGDESADIAVLRFQIDW